MRQGTATDVARDKTASSPLPGMSEFVNQQLSWQRVIPGYRVHRATGCGGKGVAHVHQDPIVNVRDRERALIQAGQVG